MIRKLKKRRQRQAENPDKRVEPDAPALAEAVSPESRRDGSSRTDSVSAEAARVEPAAEGPRQRPARCAPRQTHSMRGAQSPGAETQDGTGPRASAALPSGAAGMRISDLLRETRQSHDLNLADVAHALNIRRPYLEAMESGRYDQLPGSTYAVGFVRAYANYLGLDGREMVQRFKDEVAGLDDRQELVFPSPVPESKLPSLALILASLLALAVAYGAWTWISERPGAVAELVPEVPDRLRSLLEPSEEAATDNALGQAQTQVQVPLTTEPVAGEESVSLDLSVVAAAGQSDRESGSESEKASPVQDQPAPRSGRRTVSRICSWIRS